MDRIIDSHAHLNDEAFINVCELVKEYKEKGIKYVLVPGWDYPSSIKAIELSKSHESIYAAVGIHPENIEGLSISEVDKIESLLKEEKVVAIGEIGLDYHYTIDNKELQKEFFIKQIDLSFKYDLPIIIHMRDSDQELLDLLKNYKKEKGILKFKGVMHGYSGSKEMMKEFIKLGFFISFGGPVTFKNAPVKVECAKECNLELMLTETDSPYMAPVPMRGKMNEPKYVEYVLDKLSEIKEMDKDELEERIYLNFLNLFVGKNMINSTINKLIKNNITISFAESCTGGALASTLTKIPGVSKIFKGSFITYSEEYKNKYLGVSLDTIKLHGVVSSEVAREMVCGLKIETEADLCVSVTGNAGPTKGDESKELGCVYVGLSYKEKIETFKLQLTGERERIIDDVVLFVYDKISEII